MDKDLQETIKKIKKEFGDECIMTLGEKPKVDINAISTGCLSLDIALGVGGIPRGRIIEIYGLESSGKTTLACQIVAEAQKGGAAAYIDAEHALDPEYVQKLGVDLNKLILCQPNYGEEGLRVLQRLVESKNVDVVVVDSVAALVPKAEINGEIGDIQIGLQARLMSATLRKLTGVIAKTNTIVIFLNQIRNKIGCFQYTTRVSMADGSTKKIGYLVNNKIDDEVLTYNIDNGKIEKKKIINWFKNGNSDEFIQFVVERCEKNGKSSFACTPEHKILTPSGYKKAKDINKGDEVLSVIHDWQYTALQNNFFLGGLLGDGCLRYFKNEMKFQYRETHCSKQNEYLKWKASYFENKTIGKHSNGGMYFETFLSTAFKDYHSRFYVSRRKKKFPSGITLNPLILAIWYQDDGYLANQDKKAIVLCTNCFGKKSVIRLKDCLRNEFNIEAKIRENKRGEHLITMGNMSTKKFFSICGNFIHPSMRYKVPYEYKDVEFTPPTRDFERKKYITKIFKVKDKYIKPPTRSMCKFDIETENHNYFVDGTIVHNSYGNPETTPGGLALKFYSSIRLELRRSKNITNSTEEIIGSIIKAKVAKNKVAPPFKKTEFEIYYNEGISYISDLINIAVDKKIIEQAGAWFQYGKEKWQGRNSVKEYLQGNPLIVIEIKDKIMELLDKKI